MTGDTEMKDLNKFAQRVQHLGDLRDEKLRVANFFYTY